jgi:4-hydroxy-3-methylbut-2-enyl diphosphate reductase
MSPQVDLLIVVGSPTSSNSNRLRELARKLGVRRYMVDSADELLQAQWLDGKARVGLTAGASAPDSAGAAAVIERIKALGAVSVRKMHGIQETVKFPLAQRAAERSRPSMMHCGESALKSRSASARHW